MAAWRRSAAVPQPGRSRDRHRAARSTRSSRPTSPSAHVADDWFANKLAFVALLNFPLTTLDQRVQEGPKWSAAAVDETRLAHRFSSAFPPRSTRRSRKAASVGEAIHLRLQHLDAPPRRRQRAAPLPGQAAPARPHWNLRDEIKADYSDAAQRAWPSSGRCSRSWSASSPRRSRRRSSTTRTSTGTRSPTRSRPRGGEDCRRSGTRGSARSSQRARARHALRACCSDNYARRDAGRSRTRRPRRR